MIIDGELAHNNHIKMGCNSAEKNMSSSEWSDKQKWIMGIVASLTVAAVVAIGANLLSKMKSKHDIDPFKSGVELLSIPTMQKKTIGRIEVIHKPKGRKNLAYRYYDIFLSNPTSEPLTLVSAIIDTQLTNGSSKLSGEGDPIFPDVSYTFTYNPSRKYQVFPFQGPFRIKPKGVGAFRIHLIPDNSVIFIEESLEMNIRFVDARGGEYYIIREIK